MDEVGFYWPYDLDEEVVAELEKLYHELKPFPAARRMWRRLFDEGDRHCFPDGLEAAYQEQGTLGMWMRARGVSLPIAIVELARGFGMLSPGDQRWLYSELGRPESGPREADGPRPEWDAATGELWYRGALVKRVRNLRLATNVTTILDTFEEENWPRRIDDPLARANLADTLKSLNRNLDALTFERDGTGEGIVWKTH